MILRAMKVHTLIAICGILCLGVSSGITQPLPAPLHVIVGIEDIDRDRVIICPRPNADGTVLMAFFLKRKNKTGIDELLRDGVRLKRRVRIADGQRILAEGRIAGGTGGDNAHLVLAFDSAASAERAAVAIRPKLEPVPKEDFDTSLRRRLDDRRNWMQ